MGTPFFAEKAKKRLSFLKRASFIGLLLVRRSGISHLRRENALLRDQHRAAHIMLLDRHLGREELFAADERRRAAELRQQAVVIAAALTEAASLAVERQAGHDGKVDIRRGDERAALLRL